MNVKHYIDEKALVFEITEELDHHACDILRRRMDYEIQRFVPSKIIFDFNRVIFMDSAGIGLILGRYKSIASLGGTLELVNVKDRLKKILEMSGIFQIVKLIDIEQMPLQKII